MLFRSVEFMVRPSRSSSVLTNPEQAAGLIPLVHASAGPLLDIVTSFEGLPTGFHATTAQTFAAQLIAILELDPRAILGLRERARRSAVERFSTERFEEGWLDGWRGLKEAAK